MAHGELTLIHTGDFHGHLVSRPNALRGGVQEGGLARVYSLIQRIRADAAHSLLLHTGDTIQGSAEALFTRGAALVTVLNRFGIDAFAPGNWDYVYGPQRFHELFVGPDAQAPWNALAANLYYSDPKSDPDTPYAARAGERVLPAYRLVQVAGLTVALVGLTSNRGPQVMGKAVTRGLRFSNGEAELAQLVPPLRRDAGADLVVLLSELGLAYNIRIAQKIAGIDVILSSDMHEQTCEPVVIGNTVIVEEGQDGTMVGALALSVRGGTLSDWRWQAYRVDESVPQDDEIATLIDTLRAPFLAPQFQTQTNPINGARLIEPIDSVVGYTRIALHRANHAGDAMPAVIEGAAHDFLADAFRAYAGADIGAIRGFRYGTHVLPGAIRLEDLYHYIPIGPQIAHGVIRGAMLREQIEKSAAGCLSPQVETWTGGWLFNYSGVDFTLDPYAATGQRVSALRVGERACEPSAHYRYASYWTTAAPDTINGLQADDIQVCRAHDGAVLDATDIVVRYLQSLPQQTAAPRVNRVRLLSPLPAPWYRFPEIQPLHGAVPGRKTKVG